MKNKFKKLMLFSSLLLGCSAMVSAQTGGGGEANPQLRTHAESLKKFKDMRFGMFIHWGPVALRGTEISWSRGKEVAKDDYDALYKEFNPVLFDAADWVKTAKEAGMKYVVLTTRHHDGFSLWNSKYSGYDMENTPYKKDIVGQIVKECKKQGLVFGAYYSICDWWHEDYPVAYPDEGYEFHTEKEITNPKVRQRMERYIGYMKNQLKELIENYDPAFIWFDGEWEWAWTHEMGMDMYKYLRGLKDDLLINNRVDKGRQGMAGTTKGEKFAGDYGTPEQQIGVFDDQNTWESCITIAQQWAWKPNDKLKSEKECIQTLVQTIGGDGNLLLNVGPMPDGRIEQRQKDRLKQAGNWVKRNSEAVYGTRGGPYLPNDTLVSTRKENKIFLHLLKHPGKNLLLPNSKQVKVKKARFLDGNRALDFRKEKSGIVLELPETLPDSTVSVVVLELAKPLPTDIEKISLKSNH